jgi:hypothetical protein
MIKHRKFQYTRYPKRPKGTSSGSINAIDSNNIRTRAEPTPSIVGEQCAAPPHADRTNAESNLTTAILSLREKLLLKRIQELKRELKMISDRIQCLEAQVLPRPRSPYRSQSIALEWTIAFRWRHVEYESQVFTYLDHAWRINFGVNDHGDYGILLSQLPPYHDAPSRRSVEHRFDLSCCFRIINHSSGEQFERIIIHRLHLDRSSSVIGLKSFIRRDRLRRYLDNTSLTLFIDLAVLER